MKPYHGIFHPEGVRRLETRWRGQTISVSKNRFVLVRDEVEREKAEEAMPDQVCLTLDQFFQLVDAYPSLTLYVSTGVCQDRAAEIRRLLLEGRTVDEVATLLRVSQRTVQKRKSELLPKRMVGG